MDSRPLCCLQNRREMQEIAVASARWRLRFWCWRNVLVLSLATVAGGDGSLAVSGG